MLSSIAQDLMPSGGLKPGHIAKALGGAPLYRAMTLANTRSNPTVAELKRSELPLMHWSEVQRSLRDSFFLLP